MVVHLLKSVCVCVCIYLSIRNIRYKEKSYPSQVLFDDLLWLQKK